MIHAPDGQKVGFETIEAAIGQQIHLSRMRPKTRNADMAIVIATEPAVAKVRGSEDAPSIVFTQYGLAKKRRKMIEAFFELKCEYIYPR